MANAAAMALLGGLLSLGSLFGGNPDRKVEHARVMGWNLEISQDNFAGTTACSIRKSAMTYRHGVVTFQFGRHVNTGLAQFRVDDGPARDAGSVSIAAAALGARLSGRNLDNPSDGMVNIPAAELSGARQVSIRTDDRAGHKVFDLSGLSEALDAAKTKHCDVV
jgi:hypothetical protein